VKNKILEILKNNSDFISGEKLSKEFGISRAAIWKHINVIKEEGYEIESISKKGYRLKQVPDLLSYSEIKSYLKTNFIGRNYIHKDTIDSTNVFAKHMASEGAEEGTIVISEEQSSGRGRLGRAWVSPKGTGIWLSIILRPNISPFKASKLTLLGAAAVSLALEELGVDAQIKWPNDIVLNKKKICGILTEMSGEIERINYIVMGIGINVNMNNFPVELNHIASSLKIETGEEVDRKNLLANILNNFERIYKAFIENDDFSEVINICREKSILLGKEVNIISGQKTTRAKAIDIDNEGELVVQYEDETFGKVLSGEVSVRGLYGYV
jgi:BirA family biotin operon repressor/biotin-[acetyl-CoA-carboxylase] ligase